MTKEWRVGQVEFGHDEQKAREYYASLQGSRYGAGAWLLAREVGDWKPVYSRAIGDPPTACRICTRPASEHGDKVCRHGVDCIKAPHWGTGHLHAADDDGPFGVDGVDYCGRCHMVLV